MNARVLEKLQGDSLLSEPTLRAALSELPHNEAAPVLLEIAENAEQRRRGLIKKVLIIGAICFIVFFGVRLPLLFSPMRHIFWLQIVGALLSVVPITLPVFWGWLISPQKVWQTQQNAVAALLLCSQEPRFLPSLVDGLHSPKTPEWQSLLYPALTAALWNAPDDDLVLRFDAPRQNALRAFIAYEFSSALLPRSKTQSPHFDDATTDLTVAAMRTLAAAGDNKTVKVLERIIKTERNTRNETVVRDAAREFLPVLQKSIEENKAIFRRLQTLASTQSESPYAAIETYVDSLPHETSPIILAEYLMEQKQSAARARVWAGIGFVAVLGGEALIYFFSHKLDAGMVGILGSSLAVGACLCTSTLRQPVGEVQAGKIACELAKRCGDDTRLLPILLHALRPIVDKKQSEAVEKAVLHLLPLLRNGDAALVPLQLRRTLRAWLTMPRGVLSRAAKNKAMVALDALAVLGDTGALRRVEVVARYAENARHGVLLRQTAERCLEALRTRKPLA